MKATDNIVSRGEIWRGVLVLEASRQFGHDAPRPLYTPKARTAVI